MSVVLRFSVVKRERQTNLRLACVALERVVVVADGEDDDEDSVSYTHLTLPTKLEV